MVKVADCSTAKTVLKTEALSLNLEGKLLIQDIGLQFFPGILYGILGPNGSGKSTLLKTLAGIWAPTTGQILWKGENLLKKSRREISRIISLVPQNPQIHFDFTVEEIVAMGRYPYDTYKMRGGEKEIEHALSIVDAWHLRNRSILRLSQGERKRVYIARALIAESPVLLLDEPETSLDVRHQLEIWQLLKKLARQGKLIIVTNHDLSSTQRFCDEITILNQGRCLISGIYQDVLTPELLRSVFGVKIHPSLQTHFNIYTEANSKL